MNDNFNNPVYKMSQRSVFRGAPKRRSSSGTRRARNPKNERYLGFNCIDKTRGTIRCLGANKICNTESPVNNCVAPDPVRAQRNERGISPQMRDFYAKQFGGDFAEDTEVGIFGRSANVTNTRNTYLNDRQELWTFTKDELLAAIAAKGKTIPENVRTFDEIRRLALFYGITPEEATDAAGDLEDARAAGPIPPGPPNFYVAPTPRYSQASYPPFQAPPVPPRSVRTQATQTYAPPIPPRTFQTYTLPIPTRAAPPPPSILRSPSRLSQSVRTHFQGQLDDLARNRGQSAFVPIVRGPTRSTSPQRAKFRSFGPNFAHYKCYPSAPRSSSPFFV